MDPDRPASFHLARLGEAVDGLPATLDWLTPEERLRFDAMRAPRRRDQFLAGHWLLRVVAARFDGSSIEDWRFALDQQGRPCLQHRRDTDTALHASLSHSGEWVAVVVAAQPIGIDIEAASRPRDLDRLAAEVFPAKQWQPFAGLPDSERSRIFYEQWTLREAVGKREGRGLVPGIARSQYFESVSLEKADAITWQTDGLSVALAASQASTTRIDGLPVATTARGWRIAVL
ncbi:4'-phosphopantetheinyl transferase family protein [Arenimonas sp.]|uniref:4'-phosphopantetheinyl transferase family protein n=1 Tax=Arenimonas sp. TaxID=1872635 RepID=UPI0039E3F055